MNEAKRKSVCVKLVALLALSFLTFSLHALEISNRYRSPRNPERRVRRSTSLIVLHTTEAPERSSLNKLSERGEAHYGFTRLSIATAKRTMQGEACGMRKRMSTIAP